MWFYWDILKYFYDFFIIIYFSIWSGVWWVQVLLQKVIINYYRNNWELMNKNII